jgi:uncharacterized membrane protein
MFSSGHACLCRRAAPALFEFASPFCYRCTGMLVGVAVGAILGHWAAWNEQPLWLLVALSIPLSLPAVFDVLAQNLSSYRSNLIRRSITGLLLGLGIVCIGTAVRMQVGALDLEEICLAIFLHMP